MYCRKVFFLKRALILYLIFNTILPIQNAWVLHAQGVDDCKTLLNQAEEKYNTGRFDEAIDMITKCLDSADITQESKMRAYRLLGLTYIAKDYLVEAKKAVDKLLELVPNYQADPIQDPPPYVNLVEEQKAVQKTEPAEQPESKKEDEENNNLWYYIGGGIVAVAVAVVLLVSGGGGDDGGSSSQSDLPAPPDLPQ